MTSENLVLAPFDYNMVGVFFAHFLYRLFELHEGTSYLPAIKKNKVKYLLQEKSDKNIFRKVLTFNRGF